MAHEQLRGILDRARTCARGHDFEGVLSAMTEAELELNKAEEQPEGQPGDSEPGEPGDGGTEGTPEGSTGEPETPEPEAEGFGDWVNEGQAEQADGGGAEDPPAKGGRRKR